MRTPFYYGQSCWLTTLIQKCIQQGNVHGRLYWLSVWKMVLLCIQLLGHITHTVTGFTSCLMHLPAPLHLASLPLNWHDPQVCAIQRLSDRVHRPVTTHALRKRARLQSPWRRPYCEHRPIEALTKVAEDEDVGFIETLIELIVARSRKKKIFFFWLQFGLKIRGYSIRRATVGIIAHVRYIKILTRLRGFLVIFLYILFCILCVQVSSGNCETMESWKICNFVPKASE